MALVIFCVAAASVGVAANPAGKPDESGARDLFRLLNQERAKQGRAPLEWDARLAQAALGHAHLMAEKKQLSHQFSGEPSLRQRLAKTSVRLDRSAENVAYDAEIEGVHIGLMHSPPHRANILSPDYNAVGIAAVKHDGYYYVVQNFAHRLPESSASEVEDEIARNFDRLRRQAGQTSLVRRAIASLRDEACSMAHNDELNACSVKGNARYVVAFTLTEPEKLPDNVTRFRTSDELGSYAVGVCFERTPTYPSGVYWAVMTFFAKSSKEGM